MAFYQRWRAVVSQSMFLLVFAVLVAVLLGLSGLWLVERELVARAGESLSLGAAEVADKLDAMLQARDGDIEILATDPHVRGSDAAQIAEHLRAVQRAYPVYARLAVADRTGRVVASTDQSWVGQDVRDASWFQTVWHAPRVYAAPVKKTSQSMGQGQLQSVAFSSPIQGDHGTFHGVIMTEVDGALWNQLVEETVRRFAAQTQNFGTVRYRVVDSDGNLLLTFEGRDNSAINLRESGLPSAIKVATGRSGYVEEEHLIRKVPVVTGYARMHGVRSLSALQWGVLVRADRAEVLASIRSVLANVALIGAAGYALMLALIVWVKRSQQREQDHAAQAQCLIRDREAQLSAVVMHAVDGIISIDHTGRMLSFNPAAERLFGYTADEAIGRNVSMLMPEPYTSEHDGYLEKYLRTGVASVIGLGREVIGRRRDGSVFPMDLSVSEMQIDGQRCFTGLVRDITARKGAERNIRESEMRYRAVIDGAMDAIILMDESGRIASWNQKAEAMFGWSMQEAVGRDLAETIIPPSLREAHRNGLARYLRTGVGTVLNQMVDLTGLRRDGTEFPVELTVTSLALESGRMLSAFVRDVTVRNRLVEQLNERETFFRLLSNHLPIGVFEIDNRGACVYGNKMWRCLFNLSEGADNCHYTRAGSWLQWFHQDDREKVEEEWERSRTSFDRMAIECRLAEGGEEARWVNVLLWPMTTEEGVRYLGTLEDITERKRTVARTMTLLRHGRFELQTLTEARNLAELLAYAFPDPSRTQLGLTELFVNGVEHGNLGISYAEKSALLDQGQLEAELIRRSALPEHRDKRVHITVERTDRNLEMTILDDGSGFDWRRYLDLDHRRADESHGRGIAMAKAVSFDQLDFQECGNQVVVSVSLNGVHPDGWPEEGRRAA
ncbi:MAG: PAS domain S-box protein [Nitrospira sp.]